MVKNLRSEDALIPDGLHVVGQELSEDKIAEYEGYLKESHDHQEVKVFWRN